MSSAERLSALTESSITEPRLDASESRLSSSSSVESSSTSSVVVSVTAAVKSSSIMVWMEPEALPATMEAMGLRFWLT